MRAGVGRFVFASTIKVNGESTISGRPFLPDDPPQPEDAYARSKHAAERRARAHRAGHADAAADPAAAAGLRAATRAAISAALVDAVAARRWLPFGAIDNRRSLLGLPNLVDAIDAALHAMPERATTTGTSGRNVHLIADAAPVSTPDLVRAIARALGVEARLFAVPVGLLRIAGALTGRAALLERLTGSLEIDSTSFARATAWRTRPFAIDAGMLVA